MRFHPMELGHEWEYEWERLRKANQILRHINRFCEDEGEIYNVFKEERLNQLPSDIRNAIRFHNRMAEAGGFMDVYDGYYNDVVEGIRLKYMPAQELEILREMGIENPEAELMAMIHIVKSRKKDVSYSSNEVCISSQLKNIEKRLEEQIETQRKLEKEEEKPKKKSRRWFKGLGQIAQGTALSAANIGLSVGAFTFPVPAATANWSAIVSSITGVGIIFKGVGDLRGE